MSEEIFKLKTLEVEDTVIRQSRVGYKNNPTSKMVFASPDTIGDEIYSGETGIYTGEKGVNSEYLIQGSVLGNNIKTEATFTKKSKEVRLSNPILGIKKGDKIRNDIDNSFYDIVSATDSVITLDGVYESGNFEGDTITHTATIRKILIENAEFEYAKSVTGQNKIFFNQDRLEWGVTGGKFDGIVDTQKAPYVFPADDYMVAQFQEASTSGAPVITSVKSDRFTVVNDNKSPISDLGLNAVPYPHETLKVYWGPKDGQLSKKEESKDYVVNYSQEPDYQFPFPPIEERQVAFLKFLDKIDEKQLTLDENFQGYLAVSKTSEVPGASDLVTPITDIVQDTEIVKVSDTVLDKNKDYIIDYQSGLVTFIDNRNSERIVESVSFKSSLLWDGVSVIKGVSSDKVKGSLDPKFNNSLVIRPITGLAGIEGTVYFEDTDENNLVKIDDYILEYDSGAIRINDTLESNECVLVSYYVEGVQEENEDLTESIGLRTKKFPIMAGSVIATKTYTDVIGKKRSKVLEEGVDYEISALTGVIRPLAEALTGEDIESLIISYIPMAEINAILQPNTEDENSFRVTIVDDALDTISHTSLKFKVRNPQVSVPTEDPFKSDLDPTKVSYTNSILEDSILNISLKIRPGLGSPAEGLLIPGVTESTGKDEDFSLEGYTYDSKVKEIQLDGSVNTIRPDYNDVVVMSYSFIGDTLPYAPVEAIFPFIGEGGKQFYIEGHDRTGIIRPESVLRVDNYNPEEIYYFKIKRSTFDGESTKVEIYGTFPTDIRNPTFYLFDSDIVFTSLPEGTKVDKGLKPGSSKIVLSGSLLQVSEAIEINSLLEIDGSEIYRVQAVTISDGLAYVDIFPSLQSYISGDVLVSTFSVKDEGATIVAPKLSALTAPEQPAFTIMFTPPNDPVELSGRGLITIDNEKIIIQEIVSGYLNPDPYLFYFKNYPDLYTMAKAIQSTVSVFLGLRYNPFTVSLNNKELYYLSAGYWATDTVIPFGEGIEEPLPYTINIRPDLYKWVIISADKDTNKFKLEEADVSLSFGAGNLIAFKSKSTGEAYYHIVNKAEAVDNEKNKKLKDTVIYLEDNLRDNFLDPYFYRYNSAVWVDLPYLYSIDTAESSLVVASDVTKNIRSSMLLKFGETLIFKVESVTYDGVSSKIKLSPDITYEETLLVKQESYQGYIKHTDTPVYLDAVSHQPSILFTYTEAKAHTGRAEIFIDDDKIKLYEYVDGSEAVSKESSFIFSDYTDIYSLCESISNTESVIAGHKPYSTNAKAYQGVYELGTFAKLVIVPTYGINRALPYNTLVAKSTFGVEYTSAPGYTGAASIKRTPNSLILKESVEGYDDKEYTVPYSTYSSIYNLIESINSIESEVTGSNPFNVVTFSGEYSPEEFFTRGVYNIPSTVGDEFISLSKNIPATTVTDMWHPQGPLNIRRLVLESDYSLVGGNVSFTAPIAKRDRYQLNYMGLNTLSDYEQRGINVSCRFFSSLPEGSRVEAYMDYLNVDQYYIQKLTERKFLEIVTVPQVGELLQQKGGGGGSGADSGSNGSFPNYTAGNANLYYLLRDEQIKKMLYLKLYKWYKQRLRYFAAEAQIALGFKFGNSTHYWTDGVNYSTKDDNVDSDINYTLTTQDVLDQVENGFTVFFPIGYSGVSPKYYDRFGTEYKDYKDVYAYNVLDVDTATTMGKVRSWKPYWAPKKDGKHSDLDYLILRNKGPELVPGYSVPFYNSTGVEGDSFKEELIYDSDSNNYSFLKRVRVGDSLKLHNKKSYYKIGAIENRLDPIQGVGPYSNDVYQSLAETLVLESGKYFKEKGIKTFKVSKYKDVFPNNESLLYRYSLNAGYLATEKEIDKFVDGLKNRFGYTSTTGAVTGKGGVLGVPSTGQYYVRRTRQINNVISKSYIDVYVKFEVMESVFSVKGHRINVKRASAESFPVYNDEGNYGVTVQYDRIDGQVTGKNRIKKPPTPLEVLTILFPVPFAYFPEADEFFEATMGTFEEDTGDYILGSYNYADESFVADDEDSQKSINLKYLNFFDERRVDANLDALENNIVTKEDLNTDGYAVIDGTIFDGDSDTAGHSGRELKEGDIIPEHLEKGLSKFFDIDFERAYRKEEVEDGYIDSIFFRTKSRDIWFQFPDYDGDDEVTRSFGAPMNDTLKGFYDPKNIYTKLVLEKQAWLTEQLILQDVYDVQLKMARAFKDGITNAGSGKVSEGSEAYNINHSQYKKLLETIGDIIRARMERYKEMVRYLISNSPGDLGPVTGILQEDNASGPIIESYEKAITAFNTYNSFLNRSFDETSSFYKRVLHSIDQWTNHYVRWVLSIREGTVFQNQARHSRTSGLIITGFSLLDGLKVSYEIDPDVIVLTNPEVSVEYDYYNQSMGLKLRTEYPPSSDPADTGVFEATFLFSIYNTLGSLVGAINNYEYPAGISLFNASVVFTHYPEDAYTTQRLSPLPVTMIPDTGIILKVLNVDDHRLFDSRVLFLDKGSSSTLTLDNEGSINPWPTYVSYYNNPMDTSYSDVSKHNPKKKAIQGLRVPGEWQQLPSSFYDVIRFRPLQAEYETSYMFNAVYDKDVLDDIVNDQKLNLILPDRAKVSRMIEIINKIDTNGSVTEEDYAFIEETDTSKKTRDIFIKFLTVKLSSFGEDIIIRFNTRRFRTINDLVTAMNSYFYKDASGEWQPAEKGATVSDPKYVKLLEAELIGDTLDQGESSSFEIQVPYEPIIKDFSVGPYTQTVTYYGTDPLTNLTIPSVVEEEYYVDKSKILMGWVPEVKRYNKGKYVTLRLNDELEYSPGNTYGFRGFTGEIARNESIIINEGNPNADTLPFDLYSWDTNASYEIRNNWLLLHSSNVKLSIPLTGAVGTAVYVPAINNFFVGGSETYPELKGEVLGDLVDRINRSAAGNFFYANLKFVRAVDSEGKYGYFEYTYLPNSYSSIPQANLETLYLKDVSQIIKLSPNRAEGAQYSMSTGSEPQTIDSLAITSNAMVFDVVLNTGEYNSLTNAVYDFSIGSSTVFLSTDYSYDLEYLAEIDLRYYATISSVVNEINNLMAPLLSSPGVVLFLSSADSGSSDPTTLSSISEVSIPRTLKDTLGNSLITINPAVIVDPRISISNATVSVSSGKLIINAVLTYVGTYTGNVNLSQTVANVSEDISGLFPLGDNGTFFPPLFSSSVISSVYLNSSGTIINDSLGPQSFTSGVNATITVNEVFGASSTIENIVKSINDKSAITGVDASYATEEISGYKGLKAKYLSPSSGDVYDSLNSLDTSKFLGAVLSKEPGIKLLFMEKGGSYIVDGSGLSVTTVLGKESFSYAGIDNLHSWVDSISGDFNSGLRSIDVLPIKVAEAVYGPLSVVSSLGVIGNVPTHVYFEFLGDFRFYQISDYNLFAELSTVKQRLAKPWKNSEGVFEDDWYNDTNYNYDFYGRVDETADGNTTALHIEKFLGYLKNTRFNEIKNSISSEQLINNKYLWLYLKMHKEIGCDQKVKAYLKKIKEDENDANLLPQDL
jgi:hypothetical protein